MVATKREDEGIEWERVQELELQYNKLKRTMSRVESTGDEGATKKKMKHTDTVLSCFVLRCTRSDQTDRQTDRVQGPQP